MREHEINRAFGDPTGNSVITEEYRQDSMPDYSTNRDFTSLIRYAEVYEARKQRKLERRTLSKQNSQRQLKGGV